TLVLADDRWFEYLMGASADAALITSIDFAPQGPERVRRLAAATHTGIVAFSAQMEPEDFDVVSSTPISAIGRAYARLRARHDRVQLLAPDLSRHPGASAHPRPPRRRARARRRPPRSAGAPRPRAQPPPLPRRARLPPRSGPPPGRGLLHRLPGRPTADGRRAGRVACPRGHRVPRHR